MTDGQTDGRTDRQTDGIAIAYTRYSYAVARKKRRHGYDSVVAKYALVLRGLGYLASLQARVAFWAFIHVCIRQLSFLHCFNGNFRVRGGNRAARCNIEHACGTAMWIDSVPTAELLDSSAVGIVQLNILAFCIART